METRNEALFREMLAEVCGKVIRDGTGRYRYSSGRFDDAAHV